MKKFSQLFLGVAAGLMMFSCSNDEPANNGGDVNHVPGEPAYMTINLRSASMGGRSTTDGKFAYGTEKEQKITSAQFFFFDDNGVYVAQAKPWNDGNAVKDNNVEFKSNTVVILDNLTGTDYPSYVITVLNAPDFTPASTMAETAAKMEAAAQDLQYFTKDGDESLFVMSTSSYYGDDANHDNKYYYATKITPDNFSTEPVVAAPTKVVNIYVERLAAKVELKTDATKLVGETATDGSTIIYPLTATVAGELNDGSSVGTTQLYVRFTNFGLSSTAKKSYISKNLNDWFANNTVADIFTNWNDATNFRSYWGKGVEYGKATPDLNTATWADLDREVNADVAYCNEHTNTAAFSTQLGNPTAVLVGAEIVGKDGKAVGDLVRYHGVLYLKKDFFAYTINSLNANVKFEYYFLDKKEDATTNKGDGVTEETAYSHYTQLGLNNITLALESAGDNTTGSVYAQASEITLPGENDVEKGKPYSLDGKLYKKTIKDNKAVYDVVSVADALAAINVDLKAYNAEGFKDGKMFYTIPVQHLGATATATTDAEGYYGVVRNHWYVLTITKLEKLGHGVFNPGSGEIKGEDLIPSKEDEYYYLAATINVLSWKVVNQGVEL